MVPLTELWLPIVLAAVIVFIASSIMHMALKYHASDYQQLPDEARAMEAMRGTKPGYYTFPHCKDMKEMGTPAHMEKLKAGPVGMVTIIPSGPPNMARFLGMWFVYCLFVGFVAAYLAGRTLGPGTHYLQVFRVVGTAAFLGYSVAHISDLIWKGQPAGMVVKDIIDGLVYASLTAGTFGWLWPK